MKLMYKWYKYHLNVICDKCNLPIPCQSFDGQPTCQECGNISDKTWQEAIEYSNIKKIQQYDDGSTSLSGFMQIEMNYKHVDDIRCYHCQNIIETPVDMNVAGVDCNHCQQEIKFDTLNIASLKDFIFYFYKQQKKQASENIIAVRCASCGAPLNADATKHEYTCSFCNTLNIVPPALRAKKVLDDIYIGVKKFG